jgi:hypothetical protein
MSAPRSALVLPSKPFATPRRSFPRKSFATAPNRRPPPPADGTYISSATRLQPSLTAWSLLTWRVHEFSRVCFADETNPNLLLEFNRLDRLFGDFIRRARVMFNNSWPTPGKAPSPAPVSIEKSSDAVLTVWHEFIESFLSVVSFSVAPLYTYIGDRLSYLAQMLQGLSNTYDRPHPLIAVRPIRRAKSILESLKAEAIELSRGSIAGESVGFDIGTFKARAVGLAEDVHALFPDVFPNNSVTLGSIVATKRELLVACDNVIAGCEGVRVFDAKIESVTEAILGVGEALQQLLRDLRVTRTVGKPPIVSEKKDEKAKLVAPAMESCERLRAKLLQMENALTDTSSLCRPQTA